MEQAILYLTLVMLVLFVIKENNRPSAQQGGYLTNHKG